MPQDYLIAKESLFKSETTKRDYIKENKRQLSVDVSALKNKNYNKFDSSKDPLSSLIANPATGPAQVFPKYIPPGTIKIGNQYWAAKNLDVSNFLNGDPIPQALCGNPWIYAGSTSAPVWGYYSDNPALGSVYGKLYNGYAIIDSRGIGLPGWRIPTPADFEELITFLGPQAGSELKETGIDHWSSPNQYATNSTGFTALPAGIIEPDEGSAIYIGQECWFWTSQADIVYVLYDNDQGLTQVSIYSLSLVYPRGLGCSVRLIYDL